MLKLIKYEYRRNLSMIIVMLVCVVGLQAYYLGADAAQNTEHLMLSGSLLFVAAMSCVAIIFFYSIGLYSRELAAKSSYLTFMTPHASATILGAKLLATLVLGLAMVALLCACAWWDISIIVKRYPELNAFQVIADQILKQYDASVSQILMALLVLCVQFLIGFFSTVLLAYLAITLSATVLQNKKFKGVLSFLIFIAVMVGLFYIDGLFPTRLTYHTFNEVLIDTLPMAGVHLVVMIGAFIWSAVLLDKKVSL